MNILFEPFTIKNMTLRNRFVRSATFDRTDEPGTISDYLINFYSELADGGVGLIITGLAAVHPLGLLSDFQTSIFDDESIPGFKMLVNEVHKRGAKIALQLAHAGRESTNYLSGIRIKALAPSYIRDDPFFESDNHREISDQEIRDIIEVFGEGALRARQAGFDAVQVHAAHAYLAMVVSLLSEREKGPIVCKLKTSYSCPKIYY